MSLHCNNILVSNSIIHVVLYSYFQHAYESYVGSIGEDYKNFSNSDLALQQQMFRSIRYKLSGSVIIKPNAMSGIGTMLGAKKNYPLTITFSPQEKFWFDYILKMNIKKLKSNYRKFYKIVVGNSGPKKCFNELISNIRTEEAAEFIIKKFKKENSFSSINSK